MIRLTELAAAARRVARGTAQGRRASARDRRRGSHELLRLQAQLRRTTQGQRHHVRLHHRPRGPRRGGDPQALRPRSAREAGAGHRLPPGRPRGRRQGARSPRRRRLRALRALRRPDPGAAGLSTHRARARQGRASPHQGHLGPVAQEHADARVQRAVRRRRRGPVLRRQALQPDQGPEILRPQGDARVRARGRAGRNPVRQQAAHRHLPPHGRGRRRCARRSSRSAARCASRARSPTCGSRTARSKACSSPTATRWRAVTW